MGCDIHAYIEYLSGERWIGFGGDMNLPRHYELFGYLAGVRGPGPSLVEQRGFPFDAGWNARDDNHYFNKDTSAMEPCLDWHSHSWMTTDELEQALNKCNRGINVEYRAVLSAMRCFEANGHQARLVFWFDN